MTDLEKLMIEIEFKKEFGISITQAEKECKERLAEIDQSFHDLIDKHVNKQ